MNRARNCMLYSFKTYYLIFKSFNKSRNRSRVVFLHIRIKNFEALKETVNEIFHIKSLNF
jgi:hypothetical protein